MLIPKAEDAVHKAWMYRVLTAIADDIFLASHIFFKGGTCAAMRGLLDRFSIDLDFDLVDAAKIKEVRLHLEKIFVDLSLVISDKSKKSPQYFLKYQTKAGTRNSLKIDISFPPPKNNDYEPVRFDELDRILKCQTVEKMFANKLLAVMGRYQKHGSVAGRDLFDIHSFLLKGFEFKKEIIQEVSGKSAKAYLKELKIFIEKHFTQTIIDEDLNHLLTVEQFKKNRKTLKNEVVAFL